MPYPSATGADTFPKGKGASYQENSLRAVRRICVNQKRIKRKAEAMFCDFANSAGNKGEAKKICDPGLQEPFTFSPSFS